jgi:peptide/nickel transport system substrate-binding protein
MMGDGGSDARDQLFLNLLTRRRFLGYGASTAALMALAACGIGSQSTTTTKKSGGNLVVATGVEPTTLDPQIGPFIGNMSIISLVAETLLNMDHNSNIKPGLAQSWTVNSDGSVDLQLRKGITFSDGTPFNGSAVKVNLDRIGSAGTASLVGGVLLKSYTGTEIVADDHVKVHFSVPFSPALTALAIGWVGMLSPKAIQQLGQGIGQHPVGTGPFEFVEWVHQSHITLKKRADYVGSAPPFGHSGPAYLDTITFQIAPDPSTRVGLFESGQAHIIYQVPYQDVQRLKGEGLTVVRGDAVGAPISVFLREDTAPLNDIALRKAMQYATDRDSIVKTVYFGLSAPEYGPLSRNSLGYDPSLNTVYPFNVATAKQMLDAAGWAVGSDGVRSKGSVRAEFKMGIDPSFIPGELWQAQMAAIGVKVNLQNSPDAFSDIEKGLVQATYDFYKAALDPVIAMDGWYSSRSLGISDWSTFHSAQMDSLLDQATATYDKAKRATLYQQAQRLVMEDAATIPLIDPTDIWGFRANTKDYQLWISPTVVQLYDAYLT